MCKGVPGVIDINVTVVIQLVNFLVTLVVLNYLLIRPVRDIIRKRREMMEGLGREIEGFADQAEERLSAYEAELSKARDEAGARRRQAKAEAEAEEKAILAAAGKEAQAAIQARQVAVRTEADTAYAALRENVPAYADAALAKLLG